MRDKFKKFILRNGTTISVNGSDNKVLLRLANTSEIRNYLDDIEVMAVIKPCYQITLSYDSTISENSNFTLNGRNFIIRKITPIYFRNEIIFKCGVCY